MRVLAAYGLQFGRYQITQMAKQKKKQYDNTNDIFLGENLGVASVWAASGVSRDREISGNWSWVAWE